MAQQNMKDRYYGVNDPVAAKMMKRANEGGKNGAASLKPPEDKSIMSLFIGGVEEPFVTKEDLHSHFYQYVMMPFTKYCICL